MNLSAHTTEKHLHSPTGAGHYSPTGEMAERIRAFDWSKTALGPMDRWPQSLRTVVSIVLSSRYQMWMAWGEELTMFYNDAYRPTLGIKHPDALGKPAHEVWAEIWAEIGPRIDTVLNTGKATYDEGLLLFLERSGFPEETYHTFSYSPLADDDGRISGMLCVVTEETERLIGERRIRTLRDVATALSSTKTEAEVLQSLQEQLSRNGKDLPFTLTYLFDEGGDSGLAASSGLAADHYLAPKHISASSDFPWPAHEFALRPAHRTIECPSSGDFPILAGDWNKPVTQVAIVPISSQGQQKPAGYFVVGLNPYGRYDSAYSGFVDLLSGQIAAGINNARAYETERRRAEALAELDRAKTTFFSNVSHELRTPLTLMLSPVEELLAGHSGTSEGLDLLRLVHRNGLRLQKLVNSLLDFSRIEAGRMQAVFEPTDLCRYTTELATNFRTAMEKAGLNFSIRGGILPELVYVDREMWEKIVLNLLSNALKFTHTGGVTVTIQADDRFATLSVRDSGTGIPPAELPHIFERFHRVAGAGGRSLEGTGIGLALVQELVKLHGGAVSVESELSVGTEFVVSIPLGTEHLPKSQVSTLTDAAYAAQRSETFVAEALRWLPDGVSGEADPELAPGAERILLADDNTDMREYVLRLLRQQWKVTAVPNGEEALRSALDDPPDLILSDIMMPGLDGFELLKELRAHPETSTIPVILLSARAGEESRVDGLGAGADDYLVKPFTSRELLARVSAHLAMRRRREDAEKALREARATLQAFYDSSPFLMGVLELPLTESEDEQAVLLYCNTATARFLGTSVELVSGRSFRDLGTPRDVTALWGRKLRQCRAEAGPLQFEYEHPLQRGSCWFSASVGFLGHGPDGCARFSFITEDVTARKRNEALLRQTNTDLRRANSDLEQFAYSASHDLQEPLRQIAIYSELLGRKYSAQLDAKGLEYLGFCIEGAQRMEQLISGLLAWSQAARTPDSPAHLVHIGEVLETVTRNLSVAIADAGAEILAIDLPSVMADSAPMILLFQNLVSNALKYRGEERPRVVVRACDKADHWLFSVSDNGIGIRKQFQAQIFGIFKRLHDRSSYPGTGIGLAICQKIVESYGGRIWVESEPGEGSTFFFTLPGAGHVRASD